MSALRFAVLVVVLALLSGYAVADGAVATSPRLVKFSGTLANSRSTTGVTFAIYAAQAGGAPLWLETQNVTVDEKGRFTIYLGAKHADGVPIELFSSGEARWLGVQTEGQPEQPRVLLVAVPYALHSANADMLGGLPASAYVVAPSTVTSGGNYVNSATVAQAAYAIGGAVANAVPKFTDATGNMTSSALYENSGMLGIGTAYPQRALHIKGTGSNGPNLRLEDTSLPNSFWELQQSAYMNDWFGFLRYENNNGWAAIPAKSLIISNEGKFGFGISDVYNNMAERVNIGAGNLKLWGTAGTDGIIFPDGTKQTTAAKSGGVSPITAGDASISIGGTVSAPTVAVAQGGITDAKVHDMDAAKLTGYLKPDRIEDYSLPPWKIIGGVLTAGSNNFVGDQSVEGSLITSDPVSSGARTVMSRSGSATAPVQSTAISPHPLVPVNCDEQSNPQRCAQLRAASAAVLAVANQAGASAARFRVGALAGDVIEAINPEGTVFRVLNSGEVRAKSLFLMGGVAESNQSIRQGLTPDPRPLVPLPPGDAMSYIPVLTWHAYLSEVRPDDSGPAAVFIPGHPIIINRVTFAGQMEAGCAWGSYGSIKVVNVTTGASVIVRGTSGNPLVGDSGKLWQDPADVHVGADETVAIYPFSSGECVFPPDPFGGPGMTMGLSRVNVTVNYIMQ